MPSNPARYDSAFWVKSNGENVHYLSTKIATVIYYVDQTCKGWYENTWSPLSDKTEYLDRLRSKGKYRLVGCETSMSVHNNGGRHKQFAYQYIIRICPVEEVEE